MPQSAQTCPRRTWRPSCTSWIGGSSAQSEAERSWKEETCGRREKEKERDEIRRQACECLAGPTLIGVPVPDPDRCFQGCTCHTPCRSLACSRRKQTGQRCIFLQRGMPLGPSETGSKHIRRKRTRCGRQCAGPWCSYMYSPPQQALLVGT